MYGGDVSASQFGGGGFMPSDADAQAGGRSSGGGKKGGMQTLRAVTIKQLRDCSSSTEGDEAFLVSGQELTNLVVVGKIVSIVEQSTSVQLVIDDGTGKAEVKFWLDSDNGAGDQENEGGAAGSVEDPHGPSARSEWTKGTYVKIFGHLRVFQGKKHIVAFTIRTIQDKNELTFHVLNCIYTHLYITKKEQGSVQVMGQGQKRVMGPMSGAGNQQWPAPQANAGQDYGGGAMGGMSPCVKAAFDAFHAHDVLNQDTGLSFDALRQRLGTRFREDQLRQAVNDLQNDGHIYTTIDDNHFKGTGA
mmetsp:Transcript_13224/g.25147  ORF Transcript_13224/g.25147 Transcript_13224/m.25147 type:complete len:303 (+) Transcript_13224:82-990(+)